ncbi:MAG: glucosidase [Sphingobacteriaceae bacterium]|nr:glucosidase [Sphingobacteriaceae bacterium]
MANAEQSRINAQYQIGKNWLKWGPYVSERQWGTIREDYSNNGDAWVYTTHDSARSKAFRWGEEGLAGISDSEQLLCLGLALWNGKDAILKERLFGLNNGEGNHGEDVKEVYYYLDNTPMHTYMQMLYKYPQSAFPYTQLLTENARRNRHDPEFELMDTGIFDQDKYFDVFIGYAKNEEEDILIHYTVFNHGNADAEIHLLPQFWYRNNWSWEGSAAKPSINYLGQNQLLFHSEKQGKMYAYADGDPDFLFTDNESNNELLYQSHNVSPYVKDGINNYIVNGEKDQVNPAKSGTKVAVHYHKVVPAKQSLSFKLRLSNKSIEKPFEDFDEIFELRKNEADEFYAGKYKEKSSGEEQQLQRQAWAGLLWNKQYYNYDINVWLKGDAGLPQPAAKRACGRNFHWNHFMAADIILMPDKWEYPWFAAWDLAFHCIALAPIDPDFAKQQLRLLVSNNYIHPNGQLPAYEWDFTDTNPPVHAMASYKVYQTDKKNKGTGDLKFLEEVFQKLLLNFTWWVNQKDSEGNNIFEGGFLGLDNIGVFNRSETVPGGGFLEQADGTSWMAMYALNMLQISIELALQNPIYEDMAIKFSEHFLFIAGSIDNMGEYHTGLWDEQDSFYYDLLRKPDGGWDRLRVRTLVGLIPMFAVIVFSDQDWKDLPKLKTRLESFMLQRPDLVQLVNHWADKSGNDKHLFSLLRGHRMKMLLRRMLDTSEFLSDFGIRSISKKYETEPYNYWLNGNDYSVKYIPAESDTGMFGGNSNWRGPIWFPINYLLIDALKHFHEYYTDDFRVEYPTGSGAYFSLAEIADLLAKRLKSIFLKNEKAERPVFGDDAKLNHDEQFRDYILFFEYFNGDNGKGLGASHQTGWTALVALL